MATTHPDGLWPRATARWAEIAAIWPDLEPTVALQQRLVRLILDAADRLHPPLPSSLAAAHVVDRWQRGLPALRNAPVPIPESLYPLLHACCGVLADGGAGGSARHIQDALLDGRIDAGSLLSVSLARNQKAIRTSALHMGFSPNLVWLVGELGSSPLAHQLQVQITADQKGVRPFYLYVAETAAGLEGWDRGYCAICGSWPVFIESQAGSRVLRCSFCALAWSLRSRRCIYCGNDGGDFVTAAADVRRGSQCVELCAKCAGYTKVIEVADPTPFPLLAIEDLGSIDLDRAAMDRDYRRPELCDLDHLEPLRAC